MNHIEHTKTKTNRVSWIAHLDWNTRLYESTSWHKRRLRRISHLTNKVRLDLESRKISQHDILPGNDPLNTCGVIYAVVHVPSGATYVGQTINSPHKRLQQHWHTRHTSTEFRHRYLYRRMAKQPAFNFVVWPLEKIDPVLYECEDSKLRKARFRRAATHREAFWVRALNTLHPKGLNAVLPHMSLGPTRRSSRVDRWRQHCKNAPDVNHTPHTFVNIQNGTVSINTGPGPHLHTRIELSKLFAHASQQQWDAIETHISTASHSQRSRLLRWLHQNIDNNHMCSVVQELEKHIRKYLKRRYRYTSQQQKTDSQHFIKIVHAHECLRACKLRSILHDSSITQLHCDPELASSLRICDKLIPPLRAQFCNFTNVSLQVTSNMSLPPANTCPCRQAFPNCTDLVDEHVVTVNYNNIPDNGLRHLFWQGSKYRLNFNHADAIHAVTIGLNEHIDKVCTSNTARFLTAEQRTTMKDKLTTWRDEVLRRAISNLKTYNHQLQSSIPLSTHIALKHLHNNFVICPVDKTSHNLAICCKQWYLHRLSTELDSPSYTSVQESPQTILNHHAQWNKDRGYAHVNVLPYLYYVLKAHKSPATGRGIAGTTLQNQVDTANTHQPTSSTPITIGDIPQTPGQRTDTRHRTYTSSCTHASPNSHEHRHIDSQPSTPAPAEHDNTRPHEPVSRIHSTPLQKPRNSTTAASRALSYALQGVIQTLRCKDNEFFEATGARRFWIVQSAEEVINEIKGEPSIFQHLTPRTADFTAMYTKLPQDRILRNVEKAIREAHTYQKSNTPHEQLFMHTTTKMRGQWTHIQGDNCLSVEDMIAHLHFIVKNTYFMASDGTLRHQQFGIPMGTNAGPEIANLCLYMDEAAYVDKLIADGLLRDAQKHAYTRRFIDDVLSWSTLPPSADEYGLEWKETTNPDGSCTFLGVKIQKWLNGMIRLSVFDKAAEWNFHVIRYPSKYSNIPIHQPAGIFTGQTARFGQICNNMSDFKHAVTQLTLRLLLRGHHTSVLMKGWNKYVQRHHRRSTCFTTKITHWFKKMVKWALHHPLADPSMLTQKVSALQPTSTQTNTTPHPNSAPFGVDASGSCAGSTPAAHNMQQPPIPRGKRQRHDTTPAERPRKRTRITTNLCNLCGLHALNACLQSYALPSHTADTLLQVATQVDAHEDNFFSEHPDVDSRRLRALRRTLGTNRNSNGFTMSTLLHALTLVHIQHTQYSNLPISSLPNTCRAILLHKLDPEPIGHFLAICKRNDTWQLWDSTSCTQSFTSTADMLSCASEFPTVIVTFAS
jgi:Josephin